MRLTCAWLVIFCSGLMHFSLIKSTHLSLAKPYNRSTQIPSQVQISKLNMEGGTEKKPEYIGIFATDPVNGAKRVRALGLYTIIDVLKHELPDIYLQPDQRPDPLHKILDHQRAGLAHEVAKVESDLKHYEDLFLSPPGNYHCTCLYLGKGDYKVDPKDEHISTDWKYGITVIPLAVDFIVYVPGYLMAGYIKRESLSCGGVTIECANEFSHMTMLMRKDSTASAVESNDILKTLYEAEPEAFIGTGDKRAIGLNIPYKDSKIMYVIHNPFMIEGVTGSDLTNGL